MREVFGWAQSLTPVFQLVLIVCFAVIFWEPIAYKIFGYRRSPISETEGNENGVGERSSKEWFDGVSDIVKKQSEQLNMMAGTMGELAAHYNHETTELLTKISEGMTRLNQRQEEWEKYGIPTREYRMRDPVS